MRVGIEALERARVARRSDGLMSTKKRNKRFSFRLLTLFALAAIIAIVAVVWTTYIDSARAAALDRAIRQWSKSMQDFGKEYVEDDSGLLLRASFPNDPFQWSTILGKLETNENDDLTWLPLHLNTFGTCGIFSYQEYCPSFLSKDWKMVDGHDALWEWDWIDSSTDQHQIIELRFRLRPAGSKWLNSFSAPD